MDVTDKPKPNTKLRYYRDLRGWSQEEVGHAVGTDAKRVGVWERGENLPSPYFRHKLCDLFGKDAAELGFLAEQDQAALPSTQQPPEAADHASHPPSLCHTQTLDLHARSLHISISVHQQETSATSTFSEKHAIIDIRTDGPQQVCPREIEDFVNRHEFLDKAVFLSGAALFTRPDDLLHAELVDRFSSALQKPSSLDAETLHLFKTTTRGYWQLLVRGLFACPCLLEVTLEHLKMVVHLLKGTLLPSTRSALSAIASETAQLAGRLSGIMHLYEQAQGYYNLALVTAQEANNDTLYATALGYIGWLKNLTSHPEEAIVYFDEAKHIAAHYDAFTLLCFLAAEQAEAHADVAVQTNAEQPDDRDCLKSLETMNRHVERIQPTEETFGTFFDVSRQAAYHGSCYMRLKQPHLARPALLSGLKTLEPTMFTRAILLDLATTSLQEQEIERVCSYIHQSLDIILPTRAMKELHRVRRLHQQLEPWAGLQAVKEVDERLRGFNTRDT
jgi:transcriptional regulator with XRE-family HTH domain/tetratricopeptide (TPR) repeat protein